MNAVSEPVDAPFGRVIEQFGRGINRETRGQFCPPLGKFACLCDAICVCVAARLD